MGARAKKINDKAERKPKKPTTLTPEEMAIFQRVKNEARDWETITEESVDDYSLRADPFKLPDDVKCFETEKEFKFRWVERKSERLDEVRSAEVPNKWWIVNAESFSGLESLFDPILGCVSRLDQMLVFKPWWMHEKRMKMVESLTEAQDRTGTLEAKDGMVKDGALYTAGKRSGEDPRPMHQEIKAGDQIEYQEAGAHSETFGDLLDE